MSDRVAVAAKRFMNELIVVEQDLVELDLTMELYLDLHCHCNPLLNSQLIDQINLTFIIFMFLHHFTRPLYNINAWYTSM